MASLSDLPVIEGYLHDANFTPGLITRDEALQTVSLPIERICYEHAHPSRSLLVFPTVKLPWIASVLRFIDVHGLDLKWKVKNRHDPNESQMILRLYSPAPDTIAIESDGVIVSLSVGPSAEILVEDTGAPSTLRHVTDFGAGVFRGMDEIEKLRRTPNQAL